MKGSPSSSLVTMLPEDHSISNGYNGHLKKDDKIVTLKTNEEGSRRKNGENGFEQWGGYMAAKKAKLDAQFNVSNKESSLPNLEIFHGVSVYINGYTDPPEPQLREMFIQHGGTFHPYNSSKTTFVVATNLSAPSKNLYASKTIKPEWITESISAGIKLDVRKYMLYNLNEEKNQLTLTQLMGTKKSESTNNGYLPAHQSLTDKQGPINNRHEADKVDINVLRELPKDIAREMAQHYGISIDEIDEMEWLEGEEVRRDASLPSTITNSKYTSAEDTIESVIQQSIVSASSVDPYEHVERIDPAFLSALPDSIRNEVLIQFQEAKGRKGDNQVIVVDNEPQPCSSKQALERDRAFDLMASKKPIQSTETWYKAPVQLDYNEEENSLNLDISLLCDENMCQEDALMTPPRISSQSSNISTEKVSNRKSLNPISSKKRLDFGEEIVSKTLHPKILGLRKKVKRFWNLKSKKKPIIPPEVATLPALNGAIEIEDVRNQIRDGLETIQEPLPEEVESLQKYFSELVSRGWLKQTETLLRFLYRNARRLSKTSPWYHILRDIITTAQLQCIELYQHEMRFKD